MSPLQVPEGTLFNLQVIESPRRFLLLYKQALRSWVQGDLKFVYEGRWWMKIQRFNHLMASFGSLSPFAPDVRQAMFRSGKW
jgi:hypothetical protein